MTKTAIKVVSLTKDTARRAAFAERAKDACLEWSFFDALTSLHPDQTYDETRARVTKGRALLPGELGCFGSHYALWLWLAGSDCEQLVVLEDDVAVDWRCLEQLVQLDFDALQIPYLRLFAVRQPVFHKTIGRIGDLSLVRFLGYAYGTQGYIVTRSVVLSLLAMGRTVERPVDDVLDRTWAHGLANFCVVPFAVKELKTDSTITDRPRVPEPIPEGLVGRRWRYQAVEKARRAFFTAAELAKLLVIPLRIIPLGS